MQINNKLRFCQLLLGALSEHNQFACEPGNPLKRSIKCSRERKSVIVTQLQLTRLSLNWLSFKAKLFQNNKMWSFSGIIFKASGAAKETVTEIGEAGGCSRSM